MLRRGLKIVTNWWRKDRDWIAPEVFKRIDYNARRRIETKIYNEGKTSGNEYDEIEGTEYECHWIVRKPFNSSKNESI